MITRSFWYSLAAAALGLLMAGRTDAGDHANMTIAVLSDSFPHAPSHADPARLARMLTSAGYAAETISAGQLADASAFNAGRYWLAILPYGDYFPVAAREKFAAADFV